MEEFDALEWYSEQRTGSLEDLPTWRKVMLGMKRVQSLTALQLITLGSLGLGNNLMGCRLCSNFRFRLGASQTVFMLR